MGKVIADLATSAASATFAVENATSSVDYVLSGTDGSANDHLKTDGSGNLAWVAPPAATTVDFVKVITLTASNDTELEFTSTHVTSDYKQLIFMFYDMVSADDYAELRVAFSDDNGVSYDSSWYGTFFYPWTTNIDSHQSVYVPGSSYGLADATLAFNNSYDSDHGMGGEFRVQNHAGTTNVKTWQCYLSYPTYHSPVAVYNPLPGGFFDSTAAINNIKFYMGTGNITSGSIAMWGMK